MRLLKMIGLGSAEKGRGPFWLWPALTSAAGFIAALFLSRYRLGDDVLPAWLQHGDIESATSTLQVIATAVITATSIVFSLTLVTLQLASQQFSPRLLREFTRDPVTKAVLSVLATTFVYSLTVLRTVRADEPVPILAVLLAHVLGIASLAAILAFIAHIMRVVRVDTMMLTAHNGTREAIDRFYPDYDDDSMHVPEELDLDVRRARAVSAWRSGFVRMTDVEGLLKCAQRHDVILRVELRAGDHVTKGIPLARVWTGALATPDDDVMKSLDDDLKKYVFIGYERTFEQDAGFGFRQLADVAVKAMSPSINDPVTAATSVGHMADLLVELCGKRLGPTLHLDSEGKGRAIVPDRDLRYYLDVGCSQLRRFASEEPTVLSAMLQMVRDVAVSCRDDHQRSELRRVADEIVNTMAPSVPEHDAETVRDMRERVEMALTGNTIEAFSDRAGETHSI